MSCCISLREVVPLLLVLCLSQEHAEVGATFSLDMQSEIFHSPEEHICILFRLFIALL
ncbi:MULTISPECIES: hypothetical protein [unclassified Clostridium]|uniref:hypothetical protein n=1 Tax=unclassified Clostridium TaxID=2614128 RepID=UPI00029761A1|nr:MULTISPECIES: hypothetical protein [unclassified Clostridium]EKQ57877.1 MAG: hypothetical protein A370_00522 [Clostridium sp. Maddingley MBC34-26]